MTVPALLLIAAVTLDADTHVERNPVYGQLRRVGAPIAADFVYVFPAPTMPDGIAPEAQEEHIKRVVGRAFPMRLFLRSSVVAPHILRTERFETPDPQKPYRRVDFWFVAFGDLETIASEDFLNHLLKAGENEDGVGDQGQELAPADLASRGISAKAEDRKFESHAHTVFTLLNRVRVSTTSHVFWSRTPESIVAAVKLDSRFREDPEFPNRWRSMSTNEVGRKEYGPAVPYDGSAMYAKITRLARPDGALFVECHLVYCEPFGWFDGHNLLGSKLPLIVQSKVRSIRRELIKATRDSNAPRPGGR